MKISKIDNEVIDELEPPKSGTLWMNYKGCVVVDIHTFIEILQDENEIQHQLIEATTALKALREAQNEHK